MAIDAPFARHKEREIKAHQGKVGYATSTSRVMAFFGVVCPAIYCPVRSLHESGGVLQHGPACMQVYCLGWDCEGQKLASASIDKTVRVWNVEARHKVLVHEQ